MKTMTISDTAQWLLARDHFCILTHRKPDGDTIGSAAALCAGLRQLGKTAHVLRNPELTPRYAPWHLPYAKEQAGDGDTILTVDTAAPNMLPDAFFSLLPRVELLIDHHGTNREFAPQGIVEPDSAACAEIILEILTAMGVSLEKEIADALYVAISTDTGCFRFANTTSRTFSAAARCAAAGADYRAINQILFETVSLAKLRMQAYMVDNAIFSKDGSAVICPLPLSVEKELGVTEEDTDNISSFPRAIAGVRIAATLRDTGDGKVKLSVRAVPGLDAAAVCARFGGGGHKGAAGATFPMALDDAVEALKQVFAEEGLM
ncbi:MAG: bifunctional oligoribonuclease/PAP phosphatase NrnA [Faecousia sp.]